ncbi:MAG TPA: SGNH/GDSL hydrolase family protein [Spirochaetia bacterium]|nr:SGNH/GDSL hydrolase family protein [Spirochaetia bacterium]
MIQANDVIVFQGDSVTDAGRDRTSAAGLGGGYPALLASLLLAEHPELELTIYNRGISGNRTRDLLSRWDDDCLALSPSVVSILIGINNVWRRYDSDDPTEAATFRKEYHELLDRTRAAGVREIIMLEPFLLPVPEDRRAWREDLDPKITVCRELAAEFGARYVPLDGIFSAASTRVAPEYWAPDGVHPSVAGHGLIARSWMDAVG